MSYITFINFQWNHSIIFFRFSPLIWDGSSHLINFLLMIRHHCLKIPWNNSTKKLIEVMLDIWLYCRKCIIDWRQKWEFADIIVISKLWKDAWLSLIKRSSLPLHNGFKSILKEHSSILQTTIVTNNMWYLIYMLTLLQKW